MTPQEERNRRFDEKFCKLRNDGYMELINHHAPDLKSFIDSEVALAVAEREKDLVEKIEEWVSYENPWDEKSTDKFNEGALHERNRMKQFVLSLITKDK